MDGASRMGGNALTNIVTFGLRAGRTAAEEAPESRSGEIAGLPRAGVRDDGLVRPKDARAGLQSIVQEELGPCRSAGGIRRCLDALEEWKASCPPLKTENSQDLLHALELKGLSCTAEAVARAALLREESRGVHFREDFPEEREEMRPRILVSSVQGKLAAAREV